ncbi:MAG: hypothetical protein AB1921_05675 [Thermodesulfobacteriota bacterium]
MSRKYKLTGKCPQCGCSAVSHLSKEEIEKRFSGVNNVTLTCGECMKQYLADIRESCPEYADECKIR